MSSKLFNQFAKNIKPNFIKRYKRKLPKGVEIEDFFQEVFLIFWEKISQISKSKYAYFWKIADNLCVQVQQKTRNSVHLANTEENSGGGSDIYYYYYYLILEKEIDSENIACLQEMIEGGFSEADRQILLSLMYEDSLLLVQEDLVAAGILSNKIKPHSIYKKKERCLQKLRAMLAQKGLNKEAFFT